MVAHSSESRKLRGKTQCFIYMGMKNIEENLLINKREWHVPIGVLQILNLHKNKGITDIMLGFNIRTNFCH